MRTAYSKLSSLPPKDRISSPITTQNHGPTYEQIQSIAQQVRERSLDNRDTTPTCSSAGQERSLAGHNVYS